MRKLALLAMFIIFFQTTVCHAAEKCWASSPPTQLENRLVYIDQKNGKPRCFDPTMLDISKSDEKTEAMVRIYSKTSAKERIEIAKNGVNCSYVYEDIVYSCAIGKKCVTQVLSWIYLDEKYEATFKIDAQFFASIKMPYPITREMTFEDYTVFSKLLDYKKPVKEPTSPIHQAPPPMSADDGTDDSI